MTTASERPLYFCLLEVGPALDRSDWSGPEGQRTLQRQVCMLFVSGNQALSILRLPFQLLVCVLCDCRYMTASLSLDMRRFYATRKI